LHGCGGSRVRGAILGAESYVQWRVFASYEKVARFAAPSEYLRQKLPEMGFPFRIELLRNAVEPPRDSPASFEERPYVGFAGRLSPEKGVEVLLRAAARLPRLSFRIAGDGPARGDLETLARSISARNVSFLGHLDSGTLEHELRRWRIAVLPSLSPENFPYSALDAMNHGVPVVGSALGGLVEMLGNGRGVLVAPGDDAALALAVGELHGERERLAELGENGRAFVEAECRPTSYVRRLSELLPTNDRTR
jgi:glycosyltransferase involved in cell wall biosynthesis